MAPWVYDPQSGGQKIPPRLYEAIGKQAEAFSDAHAWDAQLRLVLRFKSQFCYVDTIREGDERQFPLCRLRHFKPDSWSLALFTYSNERYSPCVLSNGQWTGTFEEALEVCVPFIF
jgi:hypothetical protein